MKKLGCFLALLALCLTGCEAFIPEVISVDQPLKPELQAILEAVMINEICPEVKDMGYPCNIPDQVDEIRFVWTHNADGLVNYHLKFCLKNDCAERVDKNTE